MKVLIDISNEDMDKVQHSDGALFADVYKLMANTIRNGKPLDNVLDEIRAEIVEHAYPIIHSTNSRELGMTLYGIMQVIDRKISEVQNE